VKTPAVVTVLVRRVHFWGSVFSACNLRHMQEAVTRLRRNCAVTSSDVI
jgi:hypothetical protein